MVIMGLKSVKMLICRMEMGAVMDKGCAKRIVAMAPYDRGWSNVELVKDCGIIPYLLYKKFGHIVSFAGADGGYYPYHAMYMEGVRMEFLSNGRVSGKLKYIKENAEKIDALLLRGCYDTNFGVATLYKSLNPKGRIYVGLDANSLWMDRIAWYAPNFTEFMDSCDVIATSCRIMQEHLNLKWPWKIEHISNGYYDFTHTWKRPCFNEKENIILAVGRLGNYEKATEILLEAFARIAGRIPDWGLRLVGGIEESFEPYIIKFFEDYPELRGRVEFTGLIEDRTELLREYERAKIFALPSRKEGGTPNALVDALHGGCAIAVTRIDAYEEAIAYGRCGRAAQKGNVGEFGEVLHELCTCRDLRQLSEYAVEYSEKHFDMEKIAARVNEMLFGGDYGQDYI